MPALDLPGRVTKLENAIHELNRSFDRIELWLFVATAIVVVGLVLEYWDDIHELVARFVAWIWYGSKIPRHLIRGVAGGLLVTIGVTWELREEINASRIETDMRNDSAEVDALLTAAAKDSLGLIADANKRAEDERLERTKLEAEIAPRRLNKHQFDVLVATLKPYGGKRVAIESYSLDAEGAVLGQQIIDALNAAHVVPIDERMIVLKTDGLELGVHASGSNEDLGIAIAQTLSTNNVPTVFEGKPVSIILSSGVMPVTNADATIFIGVKPLKPF